MARVVFTKNLERHVQCPEMNVPGAGTVREVLEQVFREHPMVRGYVLDDQGALRYHMVIFVDGAQVADRERLTDLVPESGEVYIMQALSGG